MDPRAKKSILRKIAAERFVIKPLKVDRPVPNDFPCYWGDWSGYRGIGNGRKNKTKNFSEYTDIEVFVDGKRFWKRIKRAPTERL